ncbi:MAG: hypothetical protein GW876_14070 [Bacteroidetes bacterium]|nr:hypothetical protein [Bacteroidota bacterium]
MYRQIIIPENTQLLLQLPKEFVGRQVEIIAFEIEDNTSSINKISKQQRIRDIQLLFDDCRVDMSNFKFNREEANDYDK